jgi:hypothetical protein
LVQNNENDEKQLKTPSKLMKRSSSTLAESHHRRAMPAAAQNARKIAACVLHAEHLLNQKAIEIKRSTAFMSDDFKNILIYLGWTTPGIWTILSYCSPLTLTYVSKQP